MFANCLQRYQIEKLTMKLDLKTILLSTTLFLALGCSDHLFALESEDPESLEFFRTGTFCDQEDEGSVLKLFGEIDISVDLEEKKFSSSPQNEMNEGCGDLYDFMSELVREKAKQQEDNFETISVAIVPFLCEYFTNFKMDVKNNVPYVSFGGGRYSISSDDVIFQIISHKGYHAFSVTKNEKSFIFQWNSSVDISECTNCQGLNPIDTFFYRCTAAIVKSEGFSVIYNPQFNKDLIIYYFGNPALHSLEDSHFNFSFEGDFITFTYSKLFPTLFSWKGSEIPRFAFDQETNPTILLLQYDLKNARARLDNCVSLTNGHSADQETTQTSYDGGEHQ